MLPNRYKEIGNGPIHGGYGSVREVRDTYLERTVIFKSMQNPADNEQLINEIRLLSKARSRHIVEIYDVITDEHNQTQGIIIENLSGRDYLNFHLEAQGNLGEYIKALYQIATALADLHETGIVHRDLKLQNFKNSASGVLKLFDFGISAEDTEYRTRENRGTIAYAAPELFLPGAQITPEMDIYAFGACAWALASHYFPPQLLEAPPQTSGKVDSIKSLLPGIPNQLAELVDDSLDTDPAFRPKARDISNIFAKYLVRGKHKGLFTEDQRAVYELSQQANNVTISIKRHGKIKVIYNDIDFIIDDFDGDIYVNNTRIKKGMILPEACVLTFGAPELRTARSWVTFSSSQPEVIL